VSPVVVHGIVLHIQITMHTLLVSK
jgi:hypothetical protein